MLKWQPWHSRLHFPFFALGIVLLSYLVDIIPSIQKFVSRVLPLMMLLSLFVVLVNYTRPIISIPGVHKTAINDVRYRQFFSNKPELTAEYETIHTLIVSTKRNQNSIVYEGKQYINVTSNQRMIWLYKSE
jgi:uncharacterized membrane protein